jgi:acyl-CoA synthetase (AMP-forming)/AMP-acid ligase II
MIDAFAMTPEPILSAVDGYRGTIHDLDRSLSVGPAEFAAGWHALAKRMGGAGLRAGDRVIVAVGNGPLFIAAWAAIVARGASPLLVHADTPAAELKRTAERFRARFVAADVVPEAELQSVAVKLHALDCDAWVRLLWADFGDIPLAAGQSFLFLPGVPLHPTSGTTGKPKLAVRPAAAAVAEVHNYVQTIGIDRHDKLMAVAPMSHAYGHGWYVVAPMVTGASLVTMRRFDAKTVFSTCREQGITILPAVAAMLNTLLFGAGDRLYDPNRRVFTGGAPLSERTAANFERICGSRVRPLYGATETGGIAVARAEDRTAVGGCIGRPFDGVSVEIRPAKDLADLEDGYGLVHVRSASVMAGYLENEKLERATLADGWFCTGDLGRIDPDGCLHLRGRHAEVINVSGMKVLPSEVEDVIAAMPGVLEVKVYGHKTRLGSQHVRAAVVLENHLDAERIKSHCEQHLVYYKRPARVILMDALPRSSRGKIIMDQLP